MSTQINKFILMIVTLHNKIFTPAVEYFKQTMLDACLTRPLLRWDSIRQQYHLSTDVHPLIREVQIITDLLLAWRVWDRAPLGVWKTAFEALELLVSGSHASCAFNVKQLQSAAIVNRLLLICLVSLAELTIISIISNGNLGKSEIVSRFFCSIV